MIEYTNECASCGRPCLGSSCPNRNVARYKCDCCDKEFSSAEVEDGALYKYENEAWCWDCVSKNSYIKCEKCGEDAWYYDRDDRAICERCFRRSLPGAYA